MPSGAAQVPGAGAEIQGATPEVSAPLRGRAQPIPSGCTSCLGNQYTPPLEETEGKRQNPHHCHGFQYCVHVLKILKICGSLNICFITSSHVGDGLCIYL